VEIVVHRDSISYHDVWNFDLLTPVILKLTLSHAEKLFIEHEARQAGLSTLDYIRSRAGLRRRPLGRPTADQIVEMEDDAHSMLQRIGSPVAAVPPSPHPVPSPMTPAPEESPMERSATIARLRALVASKQGLVDPALDPKPK